MALQFERMKLPPAGTMGGVSFHASDVTNTPGGPQALLFGGQRQGLSGVATNCLPLRAVGQQP